MLITAEDGGIVNDPVLLRVAEDTWWLALADSDVGLYARGVALRRRAWTCEISEPPVYPVQVQGPQSKDVIGSLFGEEIVNLRYYWCAPAELDGIPVVISRTGWTGEVGFEVYLQDPIARRGAVGPHHGRRRARTTSGPSPRARPGASRPASSTTTRT